VIQLRYFASLRERLDLGDEAVTLPDDIVTVAGLQRWLQNRGEPWSEALADERLLVAVNQKITERSASIRDGDEVAWFPPVTGG
jgi:sulfur-carrier protein